jgi:RimJ/RimL family protein N-acetyltransferase
MVKARANEVVALLEAEAPVERVGIGMVFTFPAVLAYEPEVTFVRSDAPEGHALLTQLQRTGMPTELRLLGFETTDDLWAPWCVALDGGDIASIAFTARSSRAGAEAGVTTVPRFRGRGYASAAVAGWTTMDALRGRSLFYSTQAVNVSSQRVAGRLGLRFLGPRLRVS